MVAGTEGGVGRGTGGSVGLGAGGSGRGEDDPGGGFITKEHCSATQTRHNGPKQCFSSDGGGGHG